MKTLRMDNSLYNSQIKVFVSSTFSDLGEERNSLVNKVFPESRYFCESKGLDFIDIDLRWGITANESKSGDVLNVCLSVIENTYPFFVGIVGNRYGWIPRKEELNNVEELLGQYPKIEYYLEREFSITEIEMMFAVLDSDKEFEAVFFVRDNLENATLEEDEKVRLLKDKIMSQQKCSCFVYRSISEFELLARDYFKMKLNDICSTYLSVEDLYSFQQENYSKKVLAHYVPNLEQIKELDDFLFDSLRTHFVLKGSFGSGKSSLISYYMQLVNSRKGVWKVICHFNEGRGRDATISYLQKQIGKMYGYVGYSLEKQLSLIEEREEKLLLILDNISLDEHEEIDKLEYIGSALYNIVFKNRVTRNVKFLLTTDHDFCQNERFKSDLVIVKSSDYVSTHFFDMNKSQKREIAEHFFKCYSKALPYPNQLDKIANSNLQTPQMFLLFLDDLKKYGDYYSFDLHLQKLLGIINNDGNLISYFIGEMVRLYDTTDHKFVKDFFCLISVDSFFTEHELIEILGLSNNTYIFYRFFRAVSAWYSIVTKYVRSLINIDDVCSIDRYLDKSYYKRKIVDFFISHFERFPHSLKDHLRFKGSDILSEYIESFDIRFSKETLSLNELKVYESLLDVCPALYGSDIQKLKFYKQIQVINRIFETSDNIREIREYYIDIYLWLVNYVLAMRVEDQIFLFATEEEKQNEDYLLFKSKYLSSNDGFIINEEGELVILEKPEFNHLEYLNITRKLALRLKAYILRKPKPFHEKEAQFLDCGIAVCRFFLENGGDKKEIRSLLEQLYVQYRDTDIGYFTDLCSILASVYYEQTHYNLFKDRVALCLKEVKVPFPLLEDISSYDEYPLLFNSSCYIAKRGGKVGVIDLDEKLIIPFIYDYIEGCKEGVFLKCSMDGKHGLIDRNGIVMIPFVYDKIYRYIPEINMCIVKKGSMYGIFDFSKGLPDAVVYEDIEFYNNCFTIKKNGKWGVINRNRQVILPCIYSEIGINDKMWLIIKSGDKTGIASPFGEVIVEPIEEYGTLKVCKGFLLAILKTFKFRILDISNGEPMLSFDFDEYIPIYDGSVCTDCWLIKDKKKYTVSIEDEKCLLIPVD